MDQEQENPQIANKCSQENTVGQWEDNGCNFRT